MSKLTCRWDVLSDDIQTHILNIRSATKIQKCWRKIYGKDTELMMMAEQCYYRNESMFLEIPFTYEIKVSYSPECQILQFLSKQLTIERYDMHKYYWGKFMHDLRQSLYDEEFSGGPSAIYYSVSDEAYVTIREKIFDSYNNTII